jgi:hypothetical protein
MARLVAAFGLVVLASVFPLAASAQPQGQGGDGAPPVVRLSQLIRDAGYTLTDAEVAYLDADEQVQVQYVIPIVRVVTLLGPAESGLPDASVLPAVEAELQQVAALDPGASPQAPDSLARLRELAVGHRTAVRQAAVAWLAGLQAGDAEWRQRGADAFGTAQQSLGEWQQELIARYPPPAQP